QPLVLHEVAEGTGEPRLGIGGAEHDPVDPGEYDRPGAHRAWLERDVERAPVEAPRSDRLGCCSQREHLRMRSGVASQLSLVAGRADAIVAPGDHAPDRHVVMPETRLGEL